MQKSERAATLIARVALVWVGTISLALILTLSFLSSASMTARDWSSVAILAWFFVVAMFGIVRLTASPIEVLTALGTAAIIAVIPLVRAAHVLLGQAPPGHPIGDISAVLAANLSFGIFVALVACWWVRRSSTAMRSNER